MSFLALSVALTNALVDSRLPSTRVGERAASSPGEPIDASAAVEQVEAGAGLDEAVAAEGAAVVEVVPAAEVEAPAVPSVRAAVAVAPAQPIAAAPVAPVSAVRAEAPGARWRTEGIVFIEEGQEWSAADVATLDAALSALPAGVRRQLGNPALGPLYVQVNRSGTTMSGDRPYGGAANFYSTNEGRNDLVLFPGQSKPTVLHELGHAYNLRRTPAATYARVFLDPEMQSFMAAAGWQAVTPADRIATLRDHAMVEVTYRGRPVWTRVSRDDPLEDFANSFALYFSDAPGLLRLSPERYAWFEANLGR